MKITDVATAEALEIHLWICRERQSRDMAAVAFNLRETNAADAHELAKTMGGLHARYFRLCIRARSPQAALNYAALLPRSEKLHGALMNEIAKHGTLEVVQAALHLRDELGIPMDKCASIRYILPARAGHAHCLQTGAFTAAPPVQIHTFKRSVQAVFSIIPRCCPRAVHEVLCTSGQLIWWHAGPRRSRFQRRPLRPRKLREQIAIQ